MTNHSNLVVKNNSMSAEKNLSIAHLWFEAFNAHNLEKLLSLYDDEAEHFSPKLKIRHPETKGLVRVKLLVFNGINC